MLRLLSLLQTHRYWPGEELAERLAVSPRTLRRDIDRLRELGYAVDAARGVAGGYQLRAGGSLPPLLLEDEEAVAIAVGLRTSAAGAVSGMEETSVQALTKVIALMPPRLRRRMDAVRSQTDNLVWGGGPVMDPDVLTTLAQACRDDELVRFGYTAQGRRPDRAPGGADAAGVAGASVVPRRLRPRPPGLALVPARPDQRRGDDRPAVPSPSSCLPRTRWRSCSRASAGCRSGTPYACASTPTPTRSPGPWAAGGRPSPIRPAVGAC